MIDGGFRENIFGAKYFSEQTMPADEYEIIWVDYYDRPHKDLNKYSNIKVVTLNKTGEYHSSCCFNKGIELAHGTVLVIPDADQIVSENFLCNIWDIHKKYDMLVYYVHRYDEIGKGRLNSLRLNELDKKCILKNPKNYGACLTVRKKWILKINGYEMHPIFSGWFHANGLDIYTRFVNFGLAVQWDMKLKLYHPWHPSTLVPAKEYKVQKEIIEWRKSNLQYMAFQGIDNKLNIDFPKDLKNMLQNRIKRTKEKKLNWDKQNSKALNLKTLLKNILSSMNAAKNILLKQRNL